MKLIFYITTQFVRAVSWSTLGIIFLILLLDGSDQANFMSIRGIAPIHGFYNSLYRLPDFLLQTLPLIVLVSAMVTFIKLSKSMEIVAAKTSGFTTNQILIGPVSLTLLIGIIGTAFLNPISSAMNSSSNQFLISLGISNATEIQLNSEGIFLREEFESGYVVIMADKIDDLGSTLYNAKRLELSKETIFLSRVQSPTATLSENSWTMKDATSWQIIKQGDTKKINKSTHKELNFDTSITQEQILNSFSDPRTISIWQLPKFINQLQSSGFDAKRHQRYFQTELARPLTLLSMLLIACSFTTTIKIRRSLSITVVLCLLTGFSLYSFGRLISSLADNNQLPLLISSVGPSLCGIFLSISILMFREDTT